MAYALFPATAGNYVGDLRGGHRGAGDQRGGRDGGRGRRQRDHDLDDRRGRPTAASTYGTAPDALNQNATDAALGTSHSVPLTGLTQGTRYYYRVRSADAAGNATTVARDGERAGRVRHAARRPSPRPRLSRRARRARGNAASLNANDDNFFEVNSTTSARARPPGTAASPASPRRSAASRDLQGQELALVHADGRDLALDDSTWQQLDSRAVSTTEVTIADLAPSGHRRRLRSATGELRVRVRCTHDGELLRVGRAHADQVHALAGGPLSGAAARAAPAPGARSGRSPGRAARRRARRRPGRERRGRSANR